MESRRVKPALNPNAFGLTRSLKTEMQLCMKLKTDNFIKDNLSLLWMITELQELQSTTQPEYYQDIEII